MPANRGIATPLDPTDLAILKLLQKDARESFARIGRQVGLSATSVAERVRRLEHEGVIARYHAEVVAGLVGFPLTVYFLARSTTPESFFIETVQSRAEIIECYRVTGEVSFVLRAVLTGVEHLEELIHDLEQTSFITTLIVLSAALQRSGLPLGLHAK